MDKKPGIENDISNIWEILIMAKECLCYSQYMHQPDTKAERNYIDKSTDFQFIRHILWRMCIIEVAKLFSKNAGTHHFNIFHFINKFKKSGEYFHYLNDQETTKEWERRIEAMKDVIVDVLKLRNKIYAHTDAGKDLIKTDVSFADVERLLLIIEDVIREIYSSIFDTFADIDTIHFDKGRFKMIKILSYENERYNRMCEEEIYEISKNLKSV